VETGSSKNIYRSKEVIRNPVKIVYMSAEYMSYPRKMERARN
jgi:hypothetical protein